MKAPIAIIIVGLAAAPLGAGDRPARTPSLPPAVVQETISLAEQYLIDLADSAKWAKTIGYVSLGVGAAMTAGGIAILSGIEDSDDFGTFFEALGGIGLAAAGVGTTISGLTALVLASGPVRKYASVRGLADGGERERASREALISLARSGKLKRLIFAGIFSGLAVYALAGTSEPQAALAPGGLAVYQFLSKSREERACAGFLASEGIPRRMVSVGLGPGRRGGFRVAFTASF